MIKSLFDRQKNYLNSFFDSIDLEKSEEILNKLIQCKGTIILTGIGKSGIIANKLAMTMISTGTRALFLPPVDALHGDIGIVSADDIVIFLSRSGETKELLDLAYYAKKKGAFLIAIVSNPLSALAQKTDLYISLLVEKELCPFNLAPTTSTTVQLIFGDMLTVGLMNRKNFSLKDYAKNHPSGTIGQKSNLYVEDLMLKNELVPLCSKEDRIVDVLHELSAKLCGALIVTDENKRLLGVFTDGDLRRIIQAYPENFLHQKIGALMTGSPKATTPDTLIVEAVKQMQTDKLVTVLPVLENLQVVGIIRMHDIIKVGLAS